MNNVRNRTIKMSSEFLKVAEDITSCYEGKDSTCNIGKSEGLIRSGVSRAYYAAFILARHALRLDYIEKPEIHEMVIEGLKNDGHPEIADKLHRLRKKRNDADYKALSLIHI